MTIDQLLPWFGWTRPIPHPSATSTNVEVVRLRFLMPRFYFEILERDGSITDGEGDFASLDDAKVEAGRMLADVAADGLPCPPMNMVSIQILGDAREPLWEARLAYKEIDKAAISASQSCD
jgi:hypothetical protein